VDTGSRVLDPGKAKYRLAENETVLPLSEVPARWRYPDPIKSKAIRKDNHEWKNHLPW
jgi:hypothetical protein